MSGKRYLSLMIAMVLLGCQGTTNIEPKSFAVSAEIVGQSHTTRTVRHEGLGKTEILSASGSEGWLSVALITSNDKGIIAGHGLAPRLTLKGWNALKGKPLAFGVSTDTDNNSGDISFVRFTFEANSCFHFHRLSHPSMRDSNGRYRRILTGYVCQKISESTDNDVSKFLNSFTVPRIEFLNYTKDAAPVSSFQPIRSMFNPIYGEGGCTTIGTC